jgi:hypothetical protein
LSDQSHDVRDCRCPQPAFLRSFATPQLNQLKGPFVLGIGGCTQRGSQADLIADESLFVSKRHARSVHGHKHQTNTKHNDQQTKKDLLKFFVVVL